MRAEGTHAKAAAPWTGAGRRRGTISGVGAPTDARSHEGFEGYDLEDDGRTVPFEKIELPLPAPSESGVEAIAAPIAKVVEAMEVAGGVASEGCEPLEVEAPAPRAAAQGSRSVADAVLRLTRIGRYELSRKIGHGSFGVVYTARDTELDREVALKILNPSHHGDEDALHRFLREARAAARIAHPGVVTVHDCGRHVPSDGDDGDELAFIAMELLQGESLTRRLDRVGCLRAPAAAEIARQVASALEAAHRADVLHRDLKPDNVFLVPDPAVPSGERAKVLDFGLAKIGPSQHTQTGSVFGTPLYMSPEQCRSSGKIDARSDIYALGCILFELLTGRAPFEGAIFEVMESHLLKVAPRASSEVPGIPPALDALVAAMLEKAPADRPRTMAEVVERIDRAMGAGAGPSEKRDGGGAGVSAEMAALVAQEAAEEETAAREARETSAARAMPAVRDSAVAVEREEREESERSAESAAGTGRRRRASTVRAPLPQNRRKLWALVAALAIAAAIAGGLFALAAQREAAGAAATPAAPAAVQRPA